MMIQTIFRCILALALLGAWAGCANNVEKDKVDPRHDVSNSSKQEPDNTRDIGRDSTSIGHPTDSGIDKSDRQR
jgi:hypothetical protein